MELRNHTPFASMTFEARDQHQGSFHVVVLRATLQIDADETLTFCSQQAPLIMTDQYHDKPYAGSIKQSSDLAPIKPRCDVIVPATAYAPGSQPAARFEAAVRIGAPSRPRPLPPRPYGLNPTMRPSPHALAAWEHETAWAKKTPIPGKTLLHKRLTITGPRQWIKTPIGGWSLTRPVPIASLPLCYEYAFGGQCRIEADDPDARRIKTKNKLTVAQRREHPDGPDKAPAAHSVCPYNPVGTGYTEPWYIKAKRLKTVNAPQIESPDDPVRQMGQTYLPQGLGAIGETWQPRLALAGTVDQAFIENKDRHLPDEFDFTFWNCAHQDMQVPYLQGNEEIELTNLTPEGRLCFKLPGHSPYIMVRHTTGAMAAAPAGLDTLIIEPDERRVHLVWRAGVATEPAVGALEARLSLNPAAAKPQVHNTVEVMYG